MRRIIYLDKSKTIRKWLKISCLTANEMLWIADNLKDQVKDMSHIYVLDSFEFADYVGFKKALNFRRADGPYVVYIFAEDGYNKKDLAQLNLFPEEILDYVE